MVEDLGKKVDMLLKLETELSKVEGYWCEMDTILLGLHGSVEDLFSERVNTGDMTVRIDGIRQDWIRVKKDYMEYKKEVSTQYC